MRPILGFFLLALLSPTSCLELHRGAHDLRTELLEVVARMRAGGETSRLAFASALALAARPGAPELLRSAGAPAAAAFIMQSPSSTPALERLAGSLLTLLGDAPVSSQRSDYISGADGQVNIVLPSPSRVYGPDADAVLEEAMPHTLG